MNKKLLSGVLLLALACVITLGAVACDDGESTAPIPETTIESSETGAAGQAPAAVAEPVAATEHIIADGRLSFVKDRKLAFGVYGDVADISVEEMDVVTAGQELARLDTASLERTLKAADLALQLAENDRILSENGIAAAENGVSAAGIALEQAKDVLRQITYPYTYKTVYVDVPAAVNYVNYARHEITRAREALNSGAYGEASSELSQALNNLEESYDLLNRHGVGTDVFGSQQLPMALYWSLRAAEFQVDAAQAGLSTANVTLENAKTTAVKAALAVDIARNNRDVAQDTLDKAIITAPFDGLVARVNIKEGDALTAVTYSATAIELIDPAHMELKVSVYELDIPKVKVGQEVAISVDAMPGERFTGVVASVGELPASVTGAIAYEVKITFDMPPGADLRSGMGATADITVKN